jgi:hypothetical protein
MKTFKNKLEIRRDDFVNLVNGYPVELPMVTDINDTKVEEVQEFIIILKQRKRPIYLRVNFQKVIWLS